MAQQEGWQALRAHLTRVLSKCPAHAFGTVRRYAEGGPDPLDHVVAYDRGDHWQFVTFGFSELGGKENASPDLSGFGFELAFRLKKEGRPTSPPPWAVVFLQTLARYVFRNNAPFAHSHYINWGGPITAEVDTALSALAFVRDAELGGADTPNGRVAFLSVVPVVASDYARIAERDEPELLIDALRRKPSLLVTDAARGTILRV